VSDSYPFRRRRHDAALLLESARRGFRRRRRPQLRTLAVRLALTVVAVWTIAFGIGVVVH